jgi:predicted GIY-YIG superfamily endonuclease
MVYRKSIRGHSAALKGEASIKSLTRREKEKLIESQLGRETCTKLVHGA